MSSTPRGARAERLQRRRLVSFSRQHRDRDRRAQRHDELRFGGGVHGVNLHDELNVNGTTMTVGLTQKLTPLTTATFAVSRREDRFPFNPLRDSNKTETRLSVAFDPMALLKGNLSVGFTDFQPLSPAFPKYTGATLTASLSYTLFEVAKLTLAAAPGREFLRHHAAVPSSRAASGLKSRADIWPLRRGRARRLREPRLSRPRLDMLVDFANRTDHVFRYGAGLGYHQGKNLRIGLNFDQSRRDSVVGSRAFTRPHVRHLGHLRFLAMLTDPKGPRPRYSSFASSKT